VCKASIGSVALPLDREREREREREEDERVPEESIIAWASVFSKVLLAAHVVALSLDPPFPSFTPPSSSPCFFLPLDLNIWVNCVVAQ
jgi:hypothetical protein